MNHPGRPFNLGTMVPLVHLAYVSRAASELTLPAIQALLVRARVANQALDVTGILLLVDRSFFQILEGAPDVLGPLYAKIAGDRRHQRVLKLIEEPVDRRDFQDWSMGLAQASASELASLPGFRDFFATRRNLSDLGEGRARTLIEAFREGRWRSRVGE